MQIWNKHTTQEILQTLEMELAKTQAELRCAETDIHKAKNRIAFLLTAVHHLQNTDMEK